MKSTKTTKPKFLFLLSFSLIGAFLLGCEKEAVESPAYVNDSYNKVNPTNVELLCMAANIKEIFFDDGTYEVSFYRGNENYSVEVKTFRADSIIELTISDGNGFYTSIVNAAEEVIDIQGDDSYTFEDLDEGEISAESTELFRVTCAIIAHHNEHPNSHAAFADNGDEDFIPEDPSKAAKPFWKKTTVVNEFYPGLCVEITTTEAFWGLFTFENIGEPIDCRLL